MFILKKDNTVTLTPVKIGITVNDDTVINSGVVPGQTVITEGTDKLVDGSTVTLPGADSDSPATPKQKRHHHLPA